MATTLCYGVGLAVYACDDSNEEPTVFDVNVAIVTNVIGRLQKYANAVVHGGSGGAWLSVKAGSSWQIMRAS
jgi:hypothetical protein